MFQQFGNFFIKSSFTKKFQMIILGIALVFLISIGAINLIWRNALVDQLYLNTYTEVSSVSKRLYDKLSTVEQLTYRVIDNEMIQELLTKEKTNTLPNQSNRTRLRTEVNNIIRNTNFVETAYIIDTNNTNLINFIRDNKNILPNLSVDQIVAELPDYPSIGQWYFTDGLSRAIYARNIFSTKGPDLEFLGTVILSLNTSFFETEIQLLPRNSKDTLFFLNYQNSFYSTSSNHLLSSIDSIIDKIRDMPTYQNYKRLSFNQKSFYVGQQTLGSFSFFYLVPDKNILNDINNLQYGLLVAFLCIFLLFFWLINHVTKQMTTPISHLALNMRSLTDMEDIDNFKTLKSPYSIQNEVTVLYNSYDKMINEIKSLIKDNYKMKILSQEIEFKALQAQLDPHFLYNTLDSINWLAIENDQDDIADMVTSLAYLFRKKIDTSSGFATLSDEIEIVNSYVTIQKIRFQSRVDFHSVVTVSDLSIKIPKLLIQPIIENVFKYAVDKQDRTVSITMLIEQHKNNLSISIIDNGPGFPQNFYMKENAGIGLKNIQDRLLLHYGIGGQLLISSIPFKETKVTVIIPLKKEINDEKNDNH